MDAGVVEKPGVAQAQHQLFFKDIALAGGMLDELLEMLGDNPHHLYIETKHPSGQGDVLKNSWCCACATPGFSTTPAST